MAVIFLCLAKYVSAAQMKKILWLARIHLSTNYIRCERKIKTQLLPNAILFKVLHFFDVKFYFCLLGCGYVNVNAQPTVIDPAKWKDYGLCEKSWFWQCNDNLVPRVVEHVPESITCAEFVNSSSFYSNSNTRSTGCGQLKSNSNCWIERELILQFWILPNPGTYTEIIKHEI